jgi:DNA (cytosine-5)-methyltransferase 1
MQGQLKDKCNREYKSLYVKHKRQKMGLNQRQFTDFLGLGESGDRTIRGWESGEHTPSPSKWELLQKVANPAPYRNFASKSKFEFIDLFAGIGGMRYPFQEAGGRCVFTSEWDKFAKKTYSANYGDFPSGDITKISAADIPDHDILLAGFPCQAFSQAGLKRGFRDTRGTMFFEIQRILAEKKPKAFLLENVKQLRGHSKGETLRTIMSILRGEFTQDVPSNVNMSSEARAALGTKLNYWADYKVIRAADYGVPQNRERLIIVGFLKDENSSETNFDNIYKWPDPNNKETRLGQILEKNADVDPKYTISKKLWSGHKRRKMLHKKKGNGFGYSLFDRSSPYTNTISARYYKDGSEILIDQKDIGKTPRKLTPAECARLQGFPDNFILDAVSDTQIYKQFGNSVAVPAIRAVCKQILKTMKKARMMPSKQLKYKSNGQMALSLSTD